MYIVRVLTGPSAGFPTYVAGLLPEVVSGRPPAAAGVVVFHEIGVWETFAS